MKEKMRGKIKKTHEGKRYISVMCPNCKKVQNLESLAGWSFIILEGTKCEKCKGIITLDDVID